MNLNKEHDEAYWLPYDDEPNLELLIAPLTPLVDEEITEKCLVVPPIINGRMRRQAQTVNFRQGLYRRLVFQRCVRGWRQVDPTKPGLEDQNGEPIPCTEETKAAIAEQHNGLLMFGFDMATALGQSSIETIQEERARFRGVSSVSGRLSQPELPAV